jgi:hypothetical protein
MFPMSYVRLSTNIKVAIYKALVSLAMTSACPTWQYAAHALLWKLQRLQNRVRTPRCWKSWQVLTIPRIARGFQNSLRV